MVKRPVDTLMYCSACLNLPVYFSDFEMLIVWFWELSMLMPMLWLRFSLWARVQLADRATSTFFVNYGVRFLWW